MSFKIVRCDNANLPSKEQRGSDMYITTGSTAKDGHIMLGNYDWKAHTASLSVEETANGLNLTLDEEDPIFIPIPRQLVHISATDATYSNTATSVVHGSEYTNTFTSSNANFELQALEVQMCGQNVTSGCVVGNTVTIPYVSGDIHITCVYADPNRPKFDVHYNGQGVTYSNMSLKATEGYPYNTTVSIADPQGYENLVVTVQMGGNDITSEVYANGNISIPSVSGEITITCSVTPKTFSVTDLTDTHATFVGAATATFDAPYTANITFANGYEVSQVRILMNGLDVTSQVYNEGAINIAKVTGAITVNVTTTQKTYTITNTLTNVTTTNSNTSIAYGGNYSTTLNGAEGYNVGTVTVTMGGTNITATAYNSTNKSININNVSGNIVITASGTKKTYTVTHTLNQSTANNSTASVQHGDSYSVTFTPKEGYNITSVNTTMGGTNISSYYSDGTLTIPSVNGNIAITVNTSIKTFTVTNTLTNVTNPLGDTTVNYSSSYTTILQGTQGYDVSNITVTMGGVNITSTAWNDDTDTISITKVTGNILIEGSGSIKSYAVTYNLRDVISSSNVASVQHGSAYSTTLSYDEELFVNLVVQVSMGGVILNNVYNATNKTITIPNVNGNIIITATVDALNGFAITYNVDENITLTNTASTIMSGREYTTTMSVPQGAVIKNVRVQMGVNDITSTAYDANTQTITISNVTNDIAIHAEYFYGVGIVENENNDITLDSSKLVSGIYDLYYEDDDNNQLPNWDKIAEITI